jgi:glutamate-ammonia-ligase adenylyltransferase
MSDCIPREHSAAAEARVAAFDFERGAFYAQDERMDGLRTRNLGDLNARLAAAAARAADPVRAQTGAEEVLAALAATERDALVQDWQARPDTLLRVLTSLCGAAPFFMPYLLRDPAWVLELATDDLTIARTAAAYHMGLGAALAAAPEEDPGSVLRRFKYRELARITVRELSPDLVPADREGAILAELSHLADALLGAAFAVAAERVTAACGAPVWRDPKGSPLPLGFCVLGLGKLGSEELNYSSDVDLIYLFEHPPWEALGGGPSGLTPVEYFSRLAREFGRLVGESTADGFLYRIDLDLRPEGSQGPLVVSGVQLAEYYELWAATWEKAAFMKARPVAGDLALGWRTIRAIDPMIYRSAMDLAGVAAIRAMKSKVAAADERAAETFNVKVGAGGIRDIEFVAQALQLLHGGRIPELRRRSTQDALAAVADVGVLPAAVADALLASYRFLRRVENRLQMEGERQVHRLPRDDAGLARLARAMGFTDGDGVGAFLAALEQHREQIRQAFAALFDESGADRVLALFTRHAPRLAAEPAAAAMIKELATHFAHEIDASADPERAMNNLGRFIQGVGGRRFYYELLLDRPELVPRLTNLFAASEYLSSYFASHPRLIEPIFDDPKVLLLAAHELRAALGRIRRDLAAEGRRDEIELELDTLRLFHNRELINVGLLDLGEKVTRPEVERALTDIAEVCIERALDFARAEMARRGAPRGAEGEFLVVGMGKLASRELTYGSDLDVIFLYDVPGGDDERLLAAQEYFVRLAQKLIWALRTRTSEGVCCEIDARLRPSGNQGMLVTSLASFTRYHAASAALWERQALLRARPVAGGTSLGAAFDARRRRLLGRPLPPHARDEIHRIRGRMEAELAHETARRHDFKTGRGGLIDVETVVQFLQLRHGAEHAELLDVEPIGAHLDRLERLGLLAADDARTLREGWEFLQRLSSRLRIVENRSISDLDEERGDLDALARRLGYRSPQRAGGARRALLDHYRHHTAAIRAVYLRVLGLGAPAT